MHNTKGIVWLSSYPKSGNTWFRITLSRLLNRSPELCYINDIDKILGSRMVANRVWMNKMLGLDSTLLTDDEIDRLRPEAHRWYAGQAKRTIYIKTHDAYTLVDQKTPLFPAQGCLGAIYFIRNPLDVAISLAHHVKCPLDWSIHMMGNSEFAIPFSDKFTDNRDKQLRQKLLSWSLHAQSWTAADLPINVLVLRYEDMITAPLETFAKGVQFLNLDISATVLQKAIQDTSFDKLQQFEKSHGFKENPGHQGQFFRKGIAGDWRETLNDAQVEKIIQDHGDVMRQFGYLNENNQPM
ncbi:sulfotransferase domain-containing protein [Legionella dresdenensis]|uniref:Sulfotransferase domain-containing protein n=1 Tax=Legionella dresdenensis TaxID=450200 RepID=A0ABV8CG06_9GAMM